MPAYNEGDGLVTIVAEVAGVMDASPWTYEIILVDDGSKDHTWPVIGQLHEQYPAVKGLRFARNFGHQLAVHAGIKAAQGDMVAVMDSDGQDPPELLPEMFRLLGEGHDVVNCIRQKRKESALIRLCYYLFYRMYSRVVPFSISVDSGDFSAMNRRTVDIIAGVSQHTPFIRGIRSWAGGSQIDLPYERMARQAGVTKYSVRKLFVLALTGITAFSKLPLRISIVIGLLISIGSLLYAVTVAAVKLITGYPEEYTGWASLAFLVAFLGGAQLTVLGIIGEYLGHIYDSVRGMPTFQVAERVGYGDEPPRARRPGIAPAG